MIIMMLRLLIIMLLKNSQGEERIKSSHMMNWLMRQIGVVYRGSLMDLNSSVAVKKISEESRQGVNEFASEINVIS